MGKWLVKPAGNITKVCESMRYQKQFQNAPLVPVLAFICGTVFLVCGVAWMDRTDGYAMLVCGIFTLAAGWVLYRARGHYIEITAHGITHHGFKRWSVKKKDILQVEYGKKSWVDEFDRFLKICVPGHEYSVDDGFLFSEQRLAELVQAMKDLHAK